MTSNERVMAAIEFRRPDRLPRWDNFDVFGSFTPRWRDWRGVSTEDDHPADYYGIDIELAMPDEGPFFSQRGVIKEEGDYELCQDGWGRTCRQSRNHAYFMETVERLLDDPGNLDHLPFEDSGDDRRYSEYVKRVEAVRQSGRIAFSKVGGIYNRSQFMRREDRLLMDMATDEGFCHALFERVAEHLTAVALEALRRTNSWDSGIWVYDDCANSLAPMFSPGRDGGLVIGMASIGDDIDPETYDYYIGLLEKYAGYDPAMIDSQGRAN